MSKLNIVMYMNQFLANQLPKDWLVVKLDLPEHLFMFTHTCGKVTEVSLLKYKSTVAQHSM